MKILHALLISVAFLGDLAIYAEWAAYISASRRCDAEMAHSEKLNNAWAATKREDVEKSVRNAPGGSHR